MNIPKAEGPKRIPATTSAITGGSVKEELLKQVNIHANKKQMNRTFEVFEDKCKSPTYKQYRVLSPELCICTTTYQGGVPPLILQPNEEMVINSVLNGSGQPSLAPG